MTRRMGISDSCVLRIWRVHGPKPHRSEAFQVRSAPLFAEKFEAVAGLSRSPPEPAIVFCVDERSQVQAQDRTQLSNRQSDSAGAVKGNQTDRVGVQPARRLAALFTVGREATAPALLAIFFERGGSVPNG